MLVPLELDSVYKDTAKVKNHKDTIKPKRMVLQHSQKVQNDENQEVLHHVGLHSLSHSHALAYISELVSCLHELPQIQVAFAVDSIFAYYKVD